MPCSPFFSPLDYLFSIRFVSICFFFYYYFCSRTSLSILFANAMGERKKNEDDREHGKATYDEEQKMQSVWLMLVVLELEQRKSLENSFVLPHGDGCCFYSACFVAVKLIRLLLLLLRFFVLFQFPIAALTFRCVQLVGLLIHITNHCKFGCL